MSNHADLFQPLFLTRAGSQIHIMYVTIREYEHIVNKYSDYWHQSIGGYMVADQDFNTISKNGVPFTQADIDKISE